MRFTITILAALAAIQLQAQPRVYDKENTGVAYMMKEFKAPTELPVIQDIPDALEGVKDFGDWNVAELKSPHSSSIMALARSPP